MVPQVTLLMVTQESVSQGAASQQNVATSSPAATRSKPKYPGIRVTCNGNQLVAQHVETRITEGGVFYPITPSTEGGEIYQGSYAMGELNVWGAQKIAVETEGEHAAQGGATVRGGGTAHGQLHLRPGHRVCDGAVLPRARQALHDGA